jgi:hypothetical protein
MALTSPGVQVSVVDESFYTPAEPGTTPVIFVASAENKTNASGSGVAQGTLAQNAGKPFLLTSQRDLADTFGDPLFQIDANNNPIHGSELNEYGLQAAYSFLGVSNRAWVVRAPIDLNLLRPSATVPSADPTAGTYWLDSQTSQFGIQEWNSNPITVTGGQSFTNKTPLVLTESTQVTAGAPLGSIGQIGDYAVVAVTNLNTFWYRSRGVAPGLTPGQWVEVGSDEWKQSWPTVKATVANPTLVSGTFVLNDTTVTVTSGMTMAALAAAINGLNIGGVTAGVEDNRLVIYSNGAVSGPDSTLSGAIVLSKGGSGAALVAMGILSESQSSPKTFYPPSLHIAKHTQVPAFKETDTNPRPTGSVWIKTTEPNAGARWRVKLWNTETRLWESVEAPIYPTAEQAIFELDRVGGGQNLSIGALFIQSNVAGDTNPLATFKIYRRHAVGATTIRSGIITGLTDATGSGATGYNLTISATEPGSNEFSTPVTILIANGTLNNNAADASVVATAITSASVPFVTAEVDSTNRVIIRHSRGGDIRLVEGQAGNAGIFGELSIEPYNMDDGTGTPNVIYEPGTDSLASPQEYRLTNWRPLSYTPSSDAPTTLAEDGTLWYNSIVDEVDILVHNGTTWVGYQYDGATPGIEASPYYDVVDTAKTSPNGPIISATQPTQQSDGTDLVTGDLWIDTSDLENYPTIYRYREATDRWELLDSSDQTTENGVLFADARYSLTGASSAKADIVDLLDSTYLDPDCPDPALYPKGMLLWNLRRSGFNVKKFVRNYIDTGAQNTRLADASMRDYYPHRWVTESGNQADGSGSFGRKAQRKVVLQAMQAVINNNDDIRDDDSRIFNLLAAPGYPELIGEMVALNFDRGLSGFIVGDTPARLESNATALNEWATNVNQAVEDNDEGLTTRDEYLAVFYPWGFTSDNFGNNVVVPPSHMMLRTIALSDGVSDPWFAPAGTRRGGITNASSTGYINNEGEFVSVTLNEGQRDTLYSNGINPITTIAGAGLVNYGQKTRARNASSLDRINVSRLVVYLRSQLSLLAKPYIFEPNDKITRDEIKQQVESLLLELQGQRAIYDYLVVCDESNNTPNRIDRNELYVDVAIEPVKAIEFIYIPLRLKNTGEIAGL